MINISSEVIPLENINLPTVPIWLHHTVCMYVWYASEQNVYIMMHDEALGIVEAIVLV